jgi:chromosome segregation ATPase
MIPFSVGDFISSLSLVRDLIKALEQGAGSAQEYRDLIRELYSLERALLEVKHLNVDESLQHRKNAIKQVACQCQEMITSFLSKINKYQSALRINGSGNVLKDTLRKMQWALFKAEDIRKFRAQISGHWSSLLTLLMTLKLSVPV